jgi:hypothetical protein
VGIQIPTNEQPHPNCFGSQLLGVHLLEGYFSVFAFLAEGLYRLVRVSPANQEQTRFFVWKSPFTHEFIEDSQEAHVFCPRRGFLLESQTQSECAVWVWLKIYWPYSTSTLGQYLLANGDLLYIEGTSTLQSLLPCGFQLAG